MSAIDELLEHARSREAGFDKGDVPRTPARRVAIVACMDARLDLYALLGLTEGDAHVIRNAGAAITDDVIRSLAVSQRLLGTTEVMVIDHTGCGMLEVSDETLRQSLEEETGVRPEWSAEMLPDLDDDVRHSVAQLERSPFLPHRDAIRGFVYDVETGRLREVPGS